MTGLAPKKCAPSRRPYTSLTVPGTGTVAIGLPGGRQYAFPETGQLGTRLESANPRDLSRDGRTALIVVGPTHDGPGRWLLYAIPFAGGKPRLLARDAVAGGWRR